MLYERAMVYFRFVVQLMKKMLSAEANRVDLAPSLVTIAITGLLIWKILDVVKSQLPTTTKVSEDSRRDEFS